MCRARSEREDLLPSAETGLNALPEKLCRSAQFAEVSPETITASTGVGVQIRIGAAEIQVDANTDLALLRDILRAIAGIC